MTRTSRWLVLICFAAVVAAGCGGSDDDLSSPLDLPEDPTAPFGAEKEGGIVFPADARIRIIAAPPADAFVREIAGILQNESDVAIEVEVRSRAEAVAALCDDRELVVALPGREGQGDVCGDGSPPEKTHLVAHQAVGIATSEATPIECLSLAQIRRLWERGSTVTALSEIDPSLPGGHVEFVGPPRERATVALFERQALGGSAIRTYRSVEDSRVVSEILDENPKAIAFYGYSRLNEAAPGQVVFAAVRSGAECVPPARDTVQSGDYPLARQIHLYGPAGDSPEALFVRFAFENRRRAGLTTDALVTAEEPAEDGR